MSDIQIEVKGLDKLLAALDRFPKEIQETLKAAGEESAKKIVNSKGLKRYPPMTAANQPPVPFYIRGRGMQTKRGNNLSSEKLGTQWTIEAKGWNTVIGNRASYARFVHGEEQARAMGRIGWRKLADVAEEKVPDIKRIYNGWVKRLLVKLGL